MTLFLVWIELFLLLESFRAEFNQQYTQNAALCVSVLVMAMMQKYACIHLGEGFKNILRIFPLGR